MAQLKPIAPLVSADPVIDFAQGNHWRKPRQVQSLNGLAQKNSKGPVQTEQASPGVDAHRNAASCEQKILIEDMLDQEDAIPEIRGVLLFFVFVFASLGGIILAIFLALYSGFSFLPTLGVYYAVTNAVILGALVVFALLSSDDDLD
ncbi:MAG: hypothetical protein AAF198_14315 [Pseudomonadota bacterium]